MPRTLRQRIYRTLRATALTAVALLLIAFALVQFQQHLLRHRAEQLNADIASLRDHPGTWADLQRIQHRWGAFAHYDGPCNPQHCDYVIRLTDFYDSLEFNRHLHIPILLSQPYKWLGGHPTFINAELRMTQGHLWGANLFVHIMVFTPFDFFNYGYDLEPKVYFGPRLFTATFEHHIDPAVAQKGYWIGRPSGCEGCISEWVALTPSTSKADRDRLSVIDFSCLTRFRQCLDIPDIFPGVAAQKKIDGLTFPPSNLEDGKSAYGNANCDIPLEMHAIESDNILVVDLFQHATSVEYGSSVHMGIAKVMEKLKNSFTYTLGQNISIEEGTEPLSSETTTSPQSFTIPPGRYLLFFNKLNTQRPSRIDPPPCSVIPDTPQARAVIAQGIAKDPSAGENYSGTSW